MLFVLRTTFTIDIQGKESDTFLSFGESDRFLRWLYDTLPTRATMGGDVAPARWLGNRYPDKTQVVFQIETQYRNEFAAAADQLRIAAAAVNYTPEAATSVPPKGPLFTLMRVYGDAELIGVGDPTKPAATHPC